MSQRENLKEIQKIFYKRPHLIFLEVILLAMIQAGASTVGITCKDGVVLASEKRVSWPGSYFVSSRAGKKVFKITERIGVTFAGLISDMQMIARIIKAQANLFQFEHERTFPVKNAAKLLSNILFNRRYYLPYFAETIIGGISEGEEPELYVLDPIGSLIKDKYTSAGTGAAIAIGIVEDAYKDDITVEEGKELAIRAIKTATARDAASGDGCDILVITEKGIEEFFEPLDVWSS